MTFMIKIEYSLKIHLYFFSEITATKKNEFSVNFDYLFIIYL